MFDFLTPAMTDLLIQATQATLFMVAVAGTIGTAIGLPLGVFLATSRSGELFAAPWLNHVLGLLVNATRSTPFIILVVAIIPFTRLIAGTSIGTNAAIVPLTVAAAPFIARLIEAAIREVDQGPRGSGAGHGRKPPPDCLEGAAAGGAAGHHPRPYPRCRQPHRLLGDGGRRGRVVALETSASASATSVSCRK